MQKDFMAMAQGQGQAQEQLTPEEKEELTFSDQDYQESGLTPGNSPEAMKARLTELLQKSGMLEGFSKEELQDLAMEIDNYVKAMLNNDVKTIQSSYITEMLSQIGMDFGEGEEMPQEQAAPTNFAGMMPPGGGMGGQ